MADTSRPSGLAGIYRAPRNLDQIGAFSQVTLRLSSISRYYDLKGNSQYNQLKLFGEGGGNCTQHLSY